GDFQRAFDDVAIYTGLFTDELRNHATFAEEPLIEQRLVDPDNGTIGGGVYAQLQRARGLADTTAQIFRSVRGDSVAADLRFARVQAYGGMTYVLMGEVLCEAPVNRSRPYTPQELFRDFALPRLNEAITVATAARAVGAAVNPATAGSKALVAGADSIINFARVAAARAALNLNDKALAIQYASPVPLAFRFDAYYSENSSEENNIADGRLRATGNSSVSGTPFEALVNMDPRVPIPSTQRTATGGGLVFVPRSPSAYSTYTGTLPGGDFSRASNIRVASGLEARYIRAEAEGPTAENIAFIESRRLIAPGTTPASATQPTTAANYFSNLRDQRRRDFYLDAHRLGDLRRYQAQYGAGIESFSQFQTGPVPGNTGVTFADQYCLPVNRAEINSNPHYQ
ncbi:MAG: hypothetical protein KY444_06060, partial [Gemmatimonadetes bacterium]|nr:hypothetical protein [Gemmatimonadota bacterium]